MATNDLPKPPTAEAIRNALSRLDADESFAPAERVLAHAFSHHPANTILEDILTKVVLLNGLYSTNVFAVIGMARHIRSLVIDPDLAAGSPAVVDRIASITIRGKTRRHYSFATKYASWHRSDIYPIFDGLVERLLWAFRKQYRFADFSRPDMLDYPKYKAVIVSFRQFFNVQEFSFREVDKFLWSYAKDLKL